MRKYILSIAVILNAILLVGQENVVRDKFADSVEIQDHVFSVKKLPNGMLLRENLGLITTEKINGQIVHFGPRDNGKGDFEVRATVTPKGDYLLMFPEGNHYGGCKDKCNQLLAYRSKDKGKTWQGPTVPFDIDYPQHGFIPFIPKNSTRIYAFGTQPVLLNRNVEHGLGENTPIGFRYSDDDGYTWQDVHLIRPINEPDFEGMSVMRMCETDKGTWLIGSHESDWTYKPVISRQYILRSEDKGKTWEVLPNPRHGGWHAKCFGRMDEGRPIQTSNGEILFMTRTPMGKLYTAWSKDDGKTWTEPAPSTLVHPDAPPMLFMMSDGKTLMAFHHNRHHDINYNGLDGNNKPQMRDRSEIWVAFSTDGGHTWGEPHFVFCNALAETLGSPFMNYGCSYLDVFVDNGMVNIFLSHRWQRVVHLQIKESDLLKLPTKKELGLK
jgi:hypothetical protein